MQRKSVTTLTHRQLAMQVLSKILYFLAGCAPHSEEVQRLHKNIMKESFQTETSNADVSKSGDDFESFSVRSIAWDDIFDAIAEEDIFMKRQMASGRFTKNEIRYMTAMLCGLSGMEYGLISGRSGHYNLSWTVREKLGIPQKSTNLRLALQRMAETES